MRDKLAGINIPDIVKFGAMLLIYTFYMAWWASKITINDEYMIAALESHIAADSLVSNNVIKNTQALVTIAKLQDRQLDVLTRVTQQHADCRALMDSLQKRIDRLER